MWGTDGCAGIPLDDGWGWIFAGRTLERGVRGVARVQMSGAASRHSIRCARARTSLWLTGRDVASRARARRIRQSVPVRRLRQADPVLAGIHPSRLLSTNAETTTVWRSGGIVAQGASDPRPNLSEPRGRSVAVATSWSGTNRILASREAWVPSHADLRRARSDATPGGIAHMCRPYGLNRVRYFCVRLLG